MRGWRGLASLVLVGAAGCSGGAGDGPPEVHFGQDVCARCNMIVSEARFAAAVVAQQDGRPEPFVFDDVGCLFSWEESADTPIMSRWVHDYSGADWAPAEAAWYVRSGEIRSPMGSGVASCAAREEADRLSRARNGTVLDWNELRALARSEGLVAPPPAARES